jgi:hypothetical protein
MRHNNRPVIKASSLKLLNLDFLPTGQVAVRCPVGCGCWALLRRGLLQVHRPDGHARCVGSGQRIHLDVTAVQHAARLARTDHSLEGRRPSRVHVVAKPPVPVPVCRMNRAAD